MNGMGRKKKDSGPDTMKMALGITAPSGTMSPHVKAVANRKNDTEDKIRRVFQSSGSGRSRTKQTK